MINFLRKLCIRILYFVNPGDIRIRHHFTQGNLHLHSFLHKGYWVYGKRREKETMILFSELIENGDQVIEIGCHIGYMTAYFSKLVGSNGHVIGFEPGRNNLPYLRKNIHGLDNVAIVEKAVSNSAGKVVFYLDSLSGQNNSLLRDYGVRDTVIKNSGIDVVNVQAVEVEAVTLDEFVGSSPDLDTISFLKIDVEGAELLVLQGMASLLKSPLALMIEVTENATGVFDLLMNYGFTVFNPDRREITSSIGLAGNIFCLRKTDPRIRVFGSYKDS